MDVQCMAINSQKEILHSWPHRLGSDTWASAASSKTSASQEGMTMKKKKTSARKAAPTRPKKKTASKKPVARVRDTARDKVDGCDVAVTKATLDHELPAAKGGVN